MADELRNGLSGWAWHELGRSAEAAHQTRMDAAADFAARLRGEVQVDVGALIAENQALWERNRILESNYNRLYEWAGRASAALQQYGRPQRG